MTISHSYKSPYSEVTDSFIIHWSKKDDNGDIVGVNVSLSIHNVTNGIGEYQNRVNDLIGSFNKEHIDTDVPFLALSGNIVDWYVEAWEVFQKINIERAHKRVKIPDERQ